MNRPVDIFLCFEAVSPFGAEQLIVTAYSTQPPVPQTVPRRIDGETYQVFPSVEKTDTGRNAHIMIFRIGTDEFEAYTRRAHPRVS